MKLLFLLKKNNDYGSYSTCKSGLISSCQIITEELSAYGIISNIETCVDGNEIDKYVTLHKPNKCVIEALWATPIKLKELMSLHPLVEFIVRVHSKTPFLSTEGIAIMWIKDYVSLGVTLSFNNEDTSKEYKSLGLTNTYLPNLYSVEYVWNNEKTPKVVNIGCFGSIRPLKNQLLQAVGAMRYANSNNKILKFHINASRVEQRGEEVLKNIRALFTGTRHSLVEHPWLDRDSFLNLVRYMDIGLQVSFSESFNIVTADFVLEGVPIIVSEDISWMPTMTKVSGRDSLEIANKIRQGLRFKQFFSLTSSYKLRTYNKEATSVWINFLT